MTACPRQSESHQTSSYDTGAAAHDAVIASQSQNMADLSRHVQDEWIAIKKADSGSNSGHLGQDWHNYLTALSSDLRDHSKLYGALAGPHNSDEIQITGATREGGVKVRSAADGRGDSEAIVDSSGVRTTLTHSETWGNYDGRDWTGREVRPFHVSVQNDGQVYLPQGSQNVELGVLADKIAQHYGGNAEEWSWKTMSHPVRDALVDWMVHNNPPENLDSSTYLQGSGIGTIFSNGHQLRIPNSSEFQSIVKGTQS